MAQLKTQNLERGGKVLTRLLFAVLILAGILGLIFVWMVRALPHLAIAEISELTNAKIDVESVDFNLDGSVFIEKLVIRPDQTRDPRFRGDRLAPAEAGRRGTRDDDAILKADTVYARFSLTSLLLLGPRLKEIHIRDFVFNAQYDLDTDQWNIAALKINVPQNGAGRLPFVHLEKGTLQYSKVSKGQVKVLAAVPINMRFRPADEILGGYSFDITTAQRAAWHGLPAREDTAKPVPSKVEGMAVPRSKLFGSWRPGRFTIAGGISSEGIAAFMARKAGTFEKAWVIDLLDAELSYDRGNNYSLKLKIKDFAYTRKDTSRTSSAVAHASAFDSPVFLTKFGLFHALQSFFSQYRPAGKVDIDLETSGNFDRLSDSTVAGKVYCKDVSICDREFPYAIEQITGRVDFTENSVVLNNLDGKHGDVRVTFNGRLKDFGLHPPQAGKNQRYNIQITSDNMALDNDLYNALSPKQKELWSAFSPGGLAAIDYHLSRQSQTDKKKTLMVELLGAEATYRDFPYQLKNLTGRLSFDSDSITVADVVSNVNGGKITFNGKVTEWDTNRPIYYLSIKAHDISFDSNLARRLLAKQSDFYHRFDVMGLADAEVTIFTPTENLGPTGFLADLALKKTTVEVNKSAEHLTDKSPLEVCDVSAKVILTPDSTSIKSFTGRYGHSLVSLVGGISLGPREGVSLAEKEQGSRGAGSQPFRYHLTLNAEQVQLSDDLLGLLPTQVSKMVSEWQPRGKINLSAYLNKAAGKDQPNYQITVDCLGDSVNFQRFAYPLRDITGKLTITNNNVKLENITARPADSVLVITTPSIIKVNGQIALADNTLDSRSAGSLSQGRFEISASDISFSEYLGRALPKGIASSYEALSPTGRFDLNLENVEIFQAEDGQKYIDFAGVVKFKTCHFNISSPALGGQAQAELEAVLKTKGLYEIGGGFSDGQLSLIAENLEIKGKSITSLIADINYNRHLQSWEASNLIADCYGGRLIGKLKFQRQADSALEYQLQVGFCNIDLSRFLAGSTYESRETREPRFRGDRLAPAEAGGRETRDERRGTSSIVHHPSSIGNADELRTSPATAEAFPATARSAVTSAETSGTMSGSLSIGARIGDSPASGGQDSSRIGRCRLVIRDMQVGKLSPLAKLLYVLKLREQKDFAFEQMVIDSYIKHDKLFFEKFGLSGEAIAFYGSGWMDLPSENIDLTLTARGERLTAAEPSIMQSLAEGLGRAVVRMEVTGNVHDPQVETKALPVVEDSLKILGTRPR